MYGYIRGNDVPVFTKKTGCTFARAAGLLIAFTLLFSLQALMIPTAMAADEPDLTVQHITLSPSEPELGDVVTITINVKNQGLGNAGAFKVVCYIDAGVIGTNNMEPLGAGMVATTTFTWTAQNGTHTVKAICDSAGAVAESNETNNESTYTLTPLAPDLVVDSISWSPSGPSQGDPVTFTLTITNIGTSTSKATNIDLLIDGSSRGHHEIPMVGPGATVTDTYTWTTQTGQHAIKAIVDERRHVQESNENNNQMTVMFSPEAPDIVISAITTDPVSPSKNESVTVNVTVTNQGSGRAGECHLGCWLDEEARTPLSIPELASGESENITFTWVALPDTHVFDFTVDVYNRLPESDENNNQGSITLKSLVSDLIIADISWSPSDAAVGDTVTFKITVKNNGAGSSGVTRISPYIDGKFQGHLGYPTIEAGETESNTFTWVAEPGSHIISASADSDMTEKEINESNNKMIKTINIIPADLLISSITWEPKNPDLGDTVTFSVNVTNQGGGKAMNFQVAYYMDDAYLTSSPITTLEAGKSTIVKHSWKSREGRHTFTAEVDFNDHIDEENENNNTYSVVIVPNMPDLVVHAVTWSPVEITPGSEVVFDVSIKNTGTLVTAPSRVSYYMDGIAMGYMDIGPVRPEEIITREFTWPASGTSHTIEIVADSTALVQEIDEKNNSRVITLPPPDIIVDSVTWTPEAARVGEEITFSVTLGNTGQSETQPCSAVCSIDGEAPFTLTYDAIPAGGTLTATFQWTAMKGSHGLTVIADNLNSTTELDESNNEKELSFSTLTPDLSIGEISWRMENPLVQSDVYFTVTVLNTGTDTAAFSTLEYTFDDAQPIKKEVPEIPAGGSTDISIKAILPAGDHELVLKLDADNIVVELNESDNTKTYEFNTSAADLMVKTISWSPLDASAGDNITLSASVENRGKGIACGTVLVFTVDDIVIGEVDVDEIGIGETVSAELIWTITPGLHQIGAYADYNNLIPESDEDNNVTVRTFSLGGPVTKETEPVKLPVTGDIPEPGFLSDSWMMIVLIAVVFAGAAFYLLFRSFRKS